MTALQNRPHSHFAKGRSDANTKQGASVSAAKTDVLSDTQAGLEGENLVRPIHSAEWVPVPLLVPKAPPAMLRMTVDLRPINNATITEDMKMPNMDTMHSKNRHKHTYPKTVKDLSKYIFSWCDD